MLGVPENAGIGISAVSEPLAQHPRREKEEVKHFRFSLQTAVLFGGGHSLL